MGENSNLREKAELIKIAKELYAIIRSIRGAATTFKEKIIGHHIDLRALETRLFKLIPPAEITETGNPKPQAKNNEDTPVEPFMQRKASETFRAVTEDLRKVKDEEEKK